MKFFLVLVGILGIAADEVTLNEDDKFIRHFRKYKNDAIHPCDDFYRHICPEKMDELDIIADTTFFLNNTETREKIASLFENNPDLLRFKDKLTNLSSKLYDEADKRKEDPRIYSFIPMLEHRVAKLISLSRQHTLTAKEHSETARDFEEYKRIIAEEVKHSDYPDGIKQQLDDTLSELLVIIGFQGERIASEESYKEWPTVQKYTGLIHNLHDESGKKFDVHSDDELLRDLQEMLISVNFINPGFMLRVVSTGQFNAYYVREGNIVHILESTVLLSRNSTPAVKAGTIMSTIGHELYHGIFNPYLAIEKNDKYAKRRICLENHMENVCQEYQPHCHSGNKTFYEDSADLEGIQGAILWLKKRLGDDYKKPIINNTTHEQMFFYARAALWCNGAQDTTNSDDEHSSAMARVNGPLSLSPTFREAFQCKDEHKMMKLAAKAPEYCNFFGDALR